MRLSAPRLICAGGLAAVLAISLPEGAQACGPAPGWPPPFGFPDLAHTAASSYTGARAVTVEQDASGFVYRVNGQAEPVRGMGYNARLAALPIEERLAILERDFTAMRSAGVNTVFGWDPAEFDGLLLDVAEAHGLGVAMPYDVEFTANLDDPAERARARAEVLSLVERYQQHPAVRMWAVGNELLQRTVPPSWCSPESFDPASTARARLLSEFIVEVADAVHERDPNHPVIYREAEEAYTSWLTDALQARPAARPWLIYGVNGFTSRLGNVLDNLPRRGIDGPVLVSEFAPWDGERGARSTGLRQLWGQIRAREGQVIGASVYVWLTDGPESVDKQFGLVDSQGNPVDDALATISELFGGPGSVR
jgi:beta-galactosidase/beta-glucuronidase